jgi:hypothetical protein
VGVGLEAGSAEHAISTANVSARSSWRGRRFRFQGAVT